jgi:hypothetical protein
LKILFGCFRFEDPIILVFMFTVFNAVLCFLYGFGIPVSSNVVVVVQVFLFLVLFSILLLRWKFASQDLIIFSFLFMMLMLSVLFQGDASARSFFDVYVIVFSFMFALIFRERNIWPWIRIIYFIAVFVAILEILIPDTLVQFFPVGKYFFATREWVADQENTGDLEFYVGAQRPVGFYLFDSFHRVGSIFLEPLGFAYFLIMMVLAVRVYCGSLRHRFFYYLSIFFLLMLTDGRFGIFSGILMLFFPLRRMSFFVPSFLYLGGIVLAFYCVWVFSDSFGELNYRVGITFKGMYEGGSSAVLGFASLMGRFNDSGYMRYFASIGALGFLAVLLWIDFVRYYLWRMCFELDLITPFLVVFLSALFFGGAIYSAKIIVLWICFSVIASCSKKTMTRGGE